MRWVARSVGDAAGFGSFSLGTRRGATAGPRRPDDPRGARHRERRRRELRLPKNMVSRSPTARPHHRRVASDRSALPSVVIPNITPFFAFVLELVVPGALVILLLALLLTGEK
jgi:hypothetical protein